MTLVVHDVYAVNLATSGKLKLRAKGLLAEGTSTALFDACVLLHEAARIQRLAVEALPACPPATRLASLVEECWCYVEGRDPPRAAGAWGDVLRAREGVGPRTVDSILSRLAPRYESLQEGYSRVIRESPTLLAIRDAGRLAGPMRAHVPRAFRELAKVLARFPGATSLRWMQYRLAEAADDKVMAWDALARARLLAPSSPRFLAMSLLVAAWALSPARAEEQLVAVRASLDRAAAEVCLMYAHAEITLAEREPSAGRKGRWTRAREAADAGIARAETDALWMNLKATQLLLGELLAGRQPTLDVLYLAGLGEVAAAVRTDANIADLLTSRLRSSEPDRHLAA